jgi:hypothetical protein
MDPSDYIDPWEGITPQPFYTEALPCGSCGKPCSELFPCTWDSNLMVGECCPEYLGDAMPNQPICRSLSRFINQARTVKQVQDAWKEHQDSCVECRRLSRKQPQSATKAQQPEMKKEGAA